MSHKTFELIRVGSGTSLLWKPKCSMSCESQQKKKHDRETIWLEDSRGKKKPCLEEETVFSGGSFSRLAHNQIRGKPKRNQLKFVQKKSLASKACAKPEEVKVKRWEWYQCFSKVLKQSLMRATVGNKIDSHTVCFVLVRCSENTQITTPSLKWTIGIKHGSSLSSSHEFSSSAKQAPCWEFDVFSVWIVKFGLLFKVPPVHIFLPIENPCRQIYISFIFIRSFLSGEFWWRPLKSIQCAWEFWGTSGKEIF